MSDHLNRINIIVLLHYDDKYVKKYLCKLYHENGLATTVNVAELIKFPITSRRNSFSELDVIMRKVYYSCMYYTGQSV